VTETDEGRGREQRLEDPRSTACRLRRDLALNQASVAVLSPLSPRRLADLHAKAALHRVADLTAR